MNLCHAAALALVGWYLMTPNGSRALLSQGSHGSAVLRDWTVSATFQIQRECETKAAALRAEGQQKNAQCISFDPRLKSK
jgi:hypothetical protein